MINANNLFQRRQVQVTSSLDSPDVLESLQKINSNLSSAKKLIDKTNENEIKRATVVKKQEETKRRKESEQQKESQKSQKKGLLSLSPSIPKVGFFDAIKNFLLYTILGYGALKLMKFLPQILEVTKSFIPVIGVFENVIGWIFNSTVSFIDNGYKVYDNLRDLTKDIGGENFQKTFDEFSSNLTTFINGAVLVGFTIAGSGALGGAKPSKPGAAQRPPSTQRQQITQSASGRPSLQNPLRQRPEVTGGTRPSVRNPLRTRPRVTTSAPIRGGMSALKGFSGKAVPFIGPLLDFGIRTLVFKESPGRAAAAAVGTGVGQAIGTFIGTLGATALGLGTLGLGAIVAPLIVAAGATIGGFVGSWVGESLYDLAVGNKNEKIEGRASGGKIGSKRVTSKRTIRKTPKQPKKTQPRKTNPGANIGGQKEIEKLFANPKEKDVKNPTRALVSSSKSLKRIPLIGSLMGASIDASLGQNMDRNVIKNFATNLGLLVDNVVNEQVAMNTNEISRTIYAMADGGVVPSTRTIGTSKTVGQKLSDAVTKTLEVSSRTRIEEVFRELRKEMMLKDQMAPGGELPEGQPGLDGGVNVSSDNPDFWLLATASLFEALPNSDQGAADVAQAIYNRVSMPGDPWKTGGSIRTAILNPGQFQPVGERRNGGPAAWAAIKTKEDAIRFVTARGRTKEQLEKVAAALLTPSLQRSAQTFVGPRDSFRSVAFEKENNHLADDTETIRREGHVFGFEHRGATIASFRAGKLRPAQVNQNITGRVERVTETGSVSGYTVKTSSGAIVRNFSQLTSYHDGQTTSDGRLIQDFTLFKGDRFLNIPVLSPVSGRVTFSGPTGRGGLWVEIISNRGEKVSLGHFNALKVKANDTVVAFKTVIGLQGHTGRTIPSGVNGTHVHMEAPAHVMRNYINTLAKGGSPVKPVKPNVNLLGLQNTMGTIDFGKATGVGSKGYLIIPGYSAGAGAEGERTLVKKLARNAYNNIKSRNPRIKISYMDVDNMFADTEQGFKQYLKWVEQKEKEGYEVLEIHMDTEGGTGRGVIVPMSEINPAELNFAKTFGSYQRGYRDLGNPKRGASLIELGNMTEQLRRTGGTREQLNELTKPLEESVLKGATSFTTQPSASQRMAQVSKNEFTDYEQNIIAILPVIVNNSSYNPIA